MTESLVEEGGLMAIATASVEPGNLSTLYTEALEGSGDESVETALRRAYEIGRQGIGQGVGLLELATMHHEALAKALMRISRSSRIEREVQRAGAFFAESLSPYEMAQRGFRDAVDASRHLNETMEGEIKRIAHSVHDQAGQLFDAARLAMSRVGHDVSPVLQERLREIGSILDQAETELRRLSHELRPMILDDLGLVPALQVLAEGTARRSRIMVQFETSVEGRPPPRVETALYRIVQEALTNVRRHATGATGAAVTLTYDAAGIEVEVSDDGHADGGSRGDGYGITGMRERAVAYGGSIAAGPGPGGGWLVRARLAGFR